MIRKDSMLCEKERHLQHRQSGFYAIEQSQLWLRTRGDSIYQALAEPNPNLEFATYGDATEDSQWSEWYEQYDRVAFCAGCQEYRAARERRLGSEASAGA